MSKYTTQLRWIVEQEQEKVPYSTSHRYTQETWEKLGLADYDIWEPAYRETLNAKIIDHFYFYEIGFETAAQFAWHVRALMQEIMPYYNKLYETQAMLTEPLRDWYRHGKRDESNRTDGTTTENEQLGGSDVTTAGGTDSTTFGGEDTVELGGRDMDTRRKTGTETTVFDGCEAHNGQDTTTTHSRNVYSDTPMSLLGNGDPDDGQGPTIWGANYATNVTYDDGTSVLAYGHGIDRDDTTTKTFNTTDTGTTDYGKTETTGYGKTQDVEYGKTQETAYGRSGEKTVQSTSQDLGDAAWDEYGLSSSPSKLLDDWKKAWVNIDREIIKKLEVCFMGLW